MTARRFAEDSSVPVDRTRGEIRELLAEWGCSGMGWFDHTDGVVDLIFVWDPSIVARAGKKKTRCPGGHYAGGQWAMTCIPCDWTDGFKTASGQTFRVRFSLAIGTDAQKQRTAHRLMLLKIKADLNAAQAGLVKAEEVFLPFIVDGNGATFAEKMIPLLKHVALPPAGGTGGSS